VIVVIMLLLGGYLIGSIPFGYLMGRVNKGVDVRKVGSGNIGTTNVLRTLGWVPGSVVFLGDFGKGLIAVSIGHAFASLTGLDSSLVKSLTGFSSILGHNWPIFLKFKGGKGVATSAGVFVALTPMPFVLSGLTMIAVVALTRYVSVGSISAAVGLPIFIWIWPGKSVFYLLFSTLIAVMIIIRHRSNLKRLWQGTENRLGQRIKTTR